MFEQIYVIVMASIPALVSAIAIFLGVFKVLNAFSNLRKDVNCREELRQIIADNKKKNKVIADLITELRKQEYIGEDYDTEVQEIK